MILGNIHTFHGGGLLPHLEKYVELLKEITLDTPLGKTELDHGAFYSVSDTKLCKKEERLFEYHRKFIDIQFVVNGVEGMEYADINALPEGSFNEGSDIGFTDGEGTPLSLNSGDFAVFFPEDAHKPCIGEGVVRKVVVKIPVKG